ncbi:Fpg/Nei family DNA glycosylase [Nesterenkonia flava]|uniref:DNA-formamidopyrimidine glycosylase family protein n=1 Tax=Nesterenkonia flava TaxID=469799 RepID=A0ABU1FS43_9MICC|nr:DNA-formamidopyrimidine glycosylase family protein [Nesterenkonia flava]MDR5711492.1 DNA-formamidopyrimidine glycosylase family protein [Nesterenkonia flava]
MPELPEVHALAADLRERLRGHTVQRLEVLAFNALKTIDPTPQALVGATAVDVVRRGKFLDLRFGDIHLIIHLSLAGWIRWRPDAPKPASSRSRKSPLAARLMLEDGSGLDITEAGTKKGLAIYLVRDPLEVPGVADLGPDALELDRARFAAILKDAGKVRIKTVLRRQSLVAGIGNAYSDEILHAARMSPFHPADMSDDDVSELYTAMRQTLLDAVERASGHTASELKKEKKSALAVHGRFGEPCPVCGDTIQQVVYSDSSFQYCPTCQTGGKKLSDRGMDRLLK